MELESRILKKLKQFGKKMPHFRDGRINYHNAGKAFVVTCFVKFKDEVLLLKRSDKVWTYKNKWNVVAGYLDELKPIRQKALEELYEETKITKDKVSKVEIAEPFEFRDDGIKATFIVHPVLIELKEKPEIELDFEHTEARWVKTDDLGKYDSVPNMLESAKRVIPSKA